MIVVDTVMVVAWWDDAREDKGTACQLLPCIWNPCLNACLLTATHERNIFPQQSSCFPGPAPTADFAFACAQYMFTKEQLASYNGRWGRGRYLAIVGQVYDVSKGTRFYGEGFHTEVAHICCKQRRAYNTHVMKHTGMRMRPSALFVLSASRRLCSCKPRAD